MPTDVVGYIRCRRTSVNRKLSLREMDGDFCLVMRLSEVCLDHCRSWIGGRFALFSEQRLCLVRWSEGASGNFGLNSFAIQCGSQCLDHLRPCGGC